MTQAKEFENAIRNQRVYKLGASPLLWQIMEELDLEGILNSVPTGREVSNGQAGMAMVLTRLLRPKALYKVAGWLGASGLEGLFEHKAEAFNDDSLGRMLDDISEHTEEMWMKVVGQALASYPEMAEEVVHYDITSCYFEGAYKESELAQYGYSRDHRTDAKQVNIGLSVTGTSGLPMMYELLAGNVADNQTPMGHLDKLKKLFKRVEGLEKRVMVGDRAMLNQKLIAGYLEEGVDFMGPWTPSAVRDIIAAVPEAELMGAPLAYRPQSARPDDPPPYYGVERGFAFSYETKKEEEETVTLRLLVIWGEGKERLDRQKREDHLQKAEEALNAIRSNLNKRRSKKGHIVRHRIKKAIRKAPAARGLINWQLTGEDGNLHLTFSRDQEAIERAANMDGRYALVTNTDLSADALLTEFKRQSVVEQRFRIVKGPVPIRPIHLRSDRRICSLVFLTMVALVIYSILQWRVRQETPGRRRPWTGRAILEVFEEWMLAVQFFDDGSCIWLPPPLSQDQRAIWQALGLPDVAVFLDQIFTWYERCGT